MTLAELIVATNLKEIVSIPRVLENLEIENTEVFCRHAELKYLQSDDFKDDLIEILNTLLETPMPLKDFSLLFVKQPSGKLKLKATYEIEESL